MSFHLIKWLKGSFEKSRKYGQPTEWTHSHIIGKNEVNKGISKSEFHHRRQKLMENLQKMKSTGTHILIIPASKRQYMIEKIPYFYRWELFYCLACLFYTWNLNVKLWNVWNFFFKWISRVGTNLCILSLMSNTIKSLQKFLPTL